MLKGNLAPGGAVGKITGKEGLRFEGPARVFDSEEDMLAGLEATGGQIGLQTMCIGHGMATATICRSASPCHAERDLGALGRAVGAR